MDNETVKFNGSQVSCHKDGSVEWKHGQRGGKPYRTHGHKTSRGYMCVRINGSKVDVHRLIAEAYTEGYSTEISVDHVNGRRDDNRPKNLRMASHSQQMMGHRDKAQGCSSKFRGVNMEKGSGKYKAQVQRDGEKTYLGTFDSEGDAARAYDAAAYASGFFPEALNFSVRDAQKLLLCTLAVANHNN